MFRKRLALMALPLITTLSLTAASPFGDPFFDDPTGDNIVNKMIQMQKEMDHMFQRMQERRTQHSSRQISPFGSYNNMAVQNQLNDKGDHYELITNIPESKENHISINTENGMMSITAKIVHKEDRKTNGMVSSSSSMRMYQQAVSLPHDADEAKIATLYNKNGKLVITIAKKKGVVKANMVQVNGVTQKIEKKKPELNRQIETKNTPKDTVPITKEFDQTPARSVKKAE